jgi:hypothetical protein
MPATIKLQLSLENLLEAISSLELTEKLQIQEMIAQQLFEAEEAEYEEDEATQAETQSVRDEYAAGEYSTLDEYLASRANPFCSANTGKTLYRK